MPAVYDPWVISDSDPERRGNGPGDGVHALSSRTAAHAAYEALDWPAGPMQDFAAIGYCDQASCIELGLACSQGFCCAEKELYCEQNMPRPDEAAAADELAFQIGTGMFLKNAERGFRGLEFQARLEWENRFGECKAPTSMGDGAVPDYIDGLLQRAAAEPTATLRDIVVALKDRLLSDPEVAGGAEQTALEAILGAGLDTVAEDATDLEARVRKACGAMMSSAHFLLGGQASQKSVTVPRLTPPEGTFATVCAAVAGRPLPESLTVTCSGDSLTIH
jgi:hypothetical protein